MDRARSLLRTPSFTQRTFSRDPGARLAGALLAVAIGLAAQPVYAGFCDGKMNGYWCDGDKLVLCKNGGSASSQDCPCGCQSMPVGTDDKCKACSGFCGDKMNGWWCDGDDLVLCKNGDKASSSHCDCGCKSMPVGVDDECNGCGGFCSDKMSGYWCDGDDLVLCKDGNKASSSHCDCGCKSMPPGVDDECNGCGGFCSGKASGYWCEGDELVLCKDGNKASSTHCDYGCLQMPDGVDDKCGSPPDPTGPCTGMGDGWWCDGDELMHCQGGQKTSSQHCDYGCVQMAEGVDDKCKEQQPPDPVGFCSTRQDGPWCDGDNLVQCQGGKSVSMQPCQFGCLPQPPGVPDKCGAPPDPDPTGFCADKENGAWCDSDNLVQCLAGGIASSIPCQFGCLPQPPGISDKCGQPPDAPGFCSSKADGNWCDGSTLALCQAGAQVSAVACPFGCQWDPVAVDAFCKSEDGGEQPQAGPLTVTKDGACGVFSGSLDLWAGTGIPAWNQLDYPDDALGTCTGLSIADAGCTITTLAMLYEFMGAERSVGDQSGNSPTLEDAWRSQMENGHTKGYAGGNYTVGGVEKWGECLVIWAKNPSGVALQQHYNPSGSCVSYESAVVIANSLNAGRPVVAGVHWSAGAENQHWVLIVGADAHGVLLNDPYGGLAGARLDQNNIGKYVIDTFFTPYGTGVGSPGDESGVYDENGTPVPDDETVTPLPVVREPAAEDDDSDVGTVEEYSTGCNSGRNAGARAALLCAFAMLALLLLRRGRTRGARE